MNVTRSQLVKKISEQSGFYQKDVEKVLKCLDDVVFDCLCEATLDEEVQVQLVQGVKIQCVPVKERQRKDPRTQEDIICSPTCKVKAKFSQDFKLKLQENYDAKYNR